MLQPPQRASADDLILSEMQATSGMTETPEGVAPTVVLEVTGPVGPDFRIERTIRLHMPALEVREITDQILRAGASALNNARRAWQQDR